MAVESAEKVGIKPVEEFAEAREIWPRGERPAALREAAAAFRGRFATEQNRVRAVRTVDLAAAAYPVKFALGGAARTLNPLVNILNRLVVVQFDDFEGRLRTLVWEPTVADGPAEAPFYRQLLERYGEALAYRVFARIYSTVEGALAKLGIDPDAIDFVAFDHLHVQDLRLVMGTTEPLERETTPRAPLFPNALHLAQRRELDTFSSIHPMQWAWYVEQGLEGLISETTVPLDGDIELGQGLALIRTPGHTDGNQSLCINTPEGVWVSSENGVCADNWHPHLSRIPGVRKHAEWWNREVILNSNTLEDSIDQYDSMVLEKCLADANRRDPRWLNILPSSELVNWRRQWPVLPTFSYGGINYGVLEAKA